MEELDILRFQIESLQYRLTTTSSDEEIVSKLERCHKRCCLAFYKLHGDQNRLMQGIENPQSEIHVDQLIGRLLPSTYILKAHKLKC